MRKPKAKKRGVKPGTKIGKYKKSAQQIIMAALDKAGKWKVSENQVGPDSPKAYTPAPALTLCGQLEDAIMLLENRISNTIAKINSLM